MGDSARREGDVYTYGVVTQPLELHDVRGEDGFAVALNEAKVPAYHPECVRVQHDIHVLLPSEDVNRRRTL